MGILNLNNPHALREAKEIEMFDPMKEYRRPSKNVIRAFKWYNAYADRRLGMGCRPCYDKVAAALKEAHDKIEEKRTDGILLSGNV